MRGVTAPIWAVAFLAGCVSQTTVTQGTEAQTATKVDNAQRARVFTELGAAYYQRGNYGVAIEELERAQRSDPRYTMAYNVLGLVYMDLREDGKAADQFQRALGIDNTDPETNNNYGWFVCQRRDPREAMSYFQTALRNPLYATPEKAHLNMALCARKAGDNAAAEESYRSALRVVPDMPQALYGLAELRFAQGRHREAEGFLGRYGRVAGASPQALLLGTRIARSLGDKTSEANYLQQLSRRFPDAPETSEAMREAAQRPN